MAVVLLLLLLLLVLLLVVLVLMSWRLMNILRCHRVRVSSCLQGGAFHRSCAAAAGVAD
ncbi:hypothetical protein GQ42DRAFT_160418 [Ramicandelaber brevisporus]|nr:hypothetical protein GQ42DRAFT_160418 [Ramicandelaber brevisporus]